MNNKAGKFIVIDGTDGSGKGTQTKLLVNRLKAKGFRVEMADFPQYSTKSAGMVEEYLNGKYGKAKDVGPHRASVFYAVDRYDASFQIRKWIEEGAIVIANRYVTSNMAHQGGKIKDAVERQDFFQWLYKLEYEMFSIPRPDLNIILHVDARVAQKLVDQKGARDYIGGAKRDIHEKDIDHLRDAEKVYMEIASEFPGFSLLECTRDENIMSRTEINEMLWNELSKLIPELNADIEQEKSQHNQTLILKVQRIGANAKLPSRAYEHDAGFDLFSDELHSLAPKERTIIRTGIRMAIPSGFTGLIWDKGGVAKQGIHTIAGVVDSGFRGEVTVNLVNLSDDIYHIAPGQKIAQILFQRVEKIKLKETQINDTTERAEGRFGSSGLF